MADIDYPGGTGITTVLAADLEADDMTFPGCDIAGTTPQEADYSEIKDAILRSPGTIGGTTTCTNINSYLMTMTAAGAQGGKMEIKSYYAQSPPLSASAVLGVAVPSGAILLGCLLRVNTAVVDDGGDDTWSAAYSSGATQSIVTGAAAAQNTKVNKFFDPNAATPITSDVTNITFTPNGGSFTQGVIVGTVFALVLTDMDDV